MADLNLSQVSAKMTPRERAKLVIALGLKGFDAIGYEDKELPTDKDILQVVTACPPEEGREYNSYIKLRDWVYQVAMPILETQEQYLEALEGRISRIRYALSTSPIVNRAIEELRWLPRLVTREEYEKGLDKAKEVVRRGVSELEGKCNLTEWEAYHRLLAEGKIPEESTDYIDGWVEYIDKYGKTKEQLIDKAVEGAKYGLGEYLKYTNRLGKEDDTWKSYKKYEGLSDKELREEVIKDYAGEDTDISEGIKQPSKETYELWQKTVKEERERILQAVKDGKLKWVKRRIKDYDHANKKWFYREAEGVEEGSYIDWKDRHHKYEGEEGGEKGYHPLSAKCIELRYIEGKGVVNANDPDLTEEEEEKMEHIAIAPDDNYPMTTPEWVKTRKQMILTVLEMLLPVRVDKPKGLDEDKPVSIRLSRPQLEEALKGFVSKATATINDIHNYIAVVEMIEQKHFDGMQIVSRDPKNPTATISRALRAVDGLVTSHNDELKRVAEEFTKMGQGYYEFKFDNLQDLLVENKPKVDMVWVENKLAEVENSKMT